MMSNKDSINIFTCDKDLSLIEHRLNQLEESTKKLVGDSSTLITKVEVLTTKLVIASGILTLVINIAIFFMTRGVTSLNNENKAINAKRLDYIERQFNLRNNK